jgi:hypothetical protein
MRTQCVCGASCRAQRDRKLAKRRRRAELVEHRADERQVHRAKALDGADRPGRHAPASDGKSLEVQAKIEVFVDRVLARSRASLVRDLAGIVPLTRDSLADTG